MKVKDLINELQSLSPEAEIIMSQDSEGNRFSPWSGNFSIGFYKPESTWSGEFITNEDLADQDHDTRNDYYENSVDAIVIWPIN